jgi:predicted RNA-binding Zn ribbon-like protein
MDSVLREFINTLWKQNHGYGMDPLEDPVWFKQFEAKIADALTLDVSQCSAMLKATRAIMITYIQEIVDDQLDAEGLMQVIENSFQSSSGTRTVLKQSDSPHINFKPECYDLNYLIADLYGRFFDLVFTDDRTRIRICENPDCRYVFYDDSKNKSKRHCHAGCSNLMKVRRFREKQKK